MTDIVTGIVERLIFHSADNGFTVFIIKHSSSQSTTAKGYIPALHPGEHVELHGTWIMHSTFGKQFDVQHCTKKLPSTIVGLKKYLASGLIKGIGPVYAERLVNYFGEQILTVIDQEPSRLHEVSGIGKKRIECIIAGWSDQKEIANIMVFLQEKGISPTYALKIYKKYGQNSIALLHENPYRLADEIWGIGFKIADQIAQKIGIMPNDLKRIKAGILYILSTTVNKGSLYSTVSDVKSQACDILGLNATTDQDTIKYALHELYNQEKIKLISYNEEHYIGPSSYYFSEKGTAQKLLRLLEYPSSHIFDIDALYTQLRTYSHNGMSLHEDQQRGILTCLQHKITIITGGPGTGKTTLIKQLLHILDEHKIHYRLAAPTGRAAKRITESTRRPAATLHRLLDFDVRLMSFKRNEHNALDLNFLIIDEASMIDIFLAHATVKALPLHAHLVLIGDHDQLPSVGAGNFLYDIITSKKIPVIRLTTIFRQALDSLIITNAHRINKGELPTTHAPNTCNDFIYINENIPEHVPQHIHHILHTTIKQYGIAVDDTIVLVPMNRGNVGTQKLNQDIQKMLNATPTDQQVSYTGGIFKINDRVMQLRNNYDKFVFNGDMGIIERIDLHERILVVNYGDRSIDYDFSELDELVLAYAISIHKSQGSEYAAVIIPLFMQHFMLLQRNLLYTAITRSKKLCIVIGQRKAIAIAVKNTKGCDRITFLQQFLTTNLTCR